MECAIKKQMHTDRTLKKDKSTQFHNCCVLVLCCIMKFIYEGLVSNSDYIRTELKIIIRLK